MDEVRWGKRHDEGKQGLRGDSYGERHPNFPTFPGTSQNHIDRLFLGGGAFLCD